MHYYDTTPCYVARRIKKWDVINGNVITALLWYMVRCCTWVNPIHGIRFSSNHQTKRKWIQKSSKHCNHIIQFITLHILRIQKNELGYIKKNSSDNNHFGCCWKCNCCCWKGVVIVERVLLLLPNRSLKLTIRAFAVELT